MPHLEFGDKVVLPPKILLELQCSKIPTPFLFTVRAVGVNVAEGIDDCRLQYCSVQEFSAPEGQVFLPYWLMQNLHVPEGGSVIVSSTTNLPRGIYCRLQPETTSFLDLVAEIGPKLLMETALRRYSVLSVNSTIVIEYGNVRYYVRVAELKPASVVSLCGDVDLETDFMTPVKSDLKRPSTANSSSSNEAALVSDPISVADRNPAPTHNSLTSRLCYGRRLRDGGYVESSTTAPDLNTTRDIENASRKLSLNSLQKAQQIIRDKKSRPTSIDALAAASDSSVLATQLRLSQGPFSTPGYALGTATQPRIMNHTVSPGDIYKSKSEGTNAQTHILSAESTASSDFSTQQGDAHRCKLCLADVSSTNMEIHTLRCAKNPAYHKFECSICHNNILRVNKERHQHCPECTLVCESRETLADHLRCEHSACCKCSHCGALFTRTELHDHVDNGRCDHAMIPCSLCGLAFKKKDMAHHFSMCSSRTECCDVCKAYITITEFEDHRQHCEAIVLQDPVVSRNSGSSYVSTRSPHRTKTSNQAIECAYCLQEGFASIADVEHHVITDCRIAKSFAVPETSSNNNQDEADPAQTASSNSTEEPQDDSTFRPLLAQGRLRRKGDATALHRQSRSPPERPNGNNSQLNHVPTADPLVRRSATSSLLGPSMLPPMASRLAPQQAGTLRKPNPKPNTRLRPNPHLSSLPQRVSKAREGPAPSSTTTKNINSGPAELCISSAGGTSYRTALPQSRSDSSNRVRRRPAAPGRLDKLP